jgi:hypothetical protein
MPMGRNLTISGVTLRNVTSASGVLLLSAYGGSVVTLRNITISRAHNHLALVTATSGSVVTLSSSSIIGAVSNVGLVRASDGSVVHLSNVTVSGADSNTAIVTAVDAGTRVSVDSSSFTDIVGAPSSFNGVALYAGSGAQLAVSRSSFTRVSWNASLEGQAVYGEANATLTLTDVRFDGVGGCGTAVTATAGAALSLTRVYVTAVNTSGAAVRRSVVRVEGARDLIMSGCAFSNLTVDGVSAVRVADWSAFPAGASVTLANNTWANVTLSGGQAAALELRGGGAAPRVTVTGGGFTGVTGVSLWAVSMNPGVLSLTGLTVQRGVGLVSGFSPLTLFNTTALLTNW